MAESLLNDFEIPPGIKRNSSLAAARGRYIGGDKIRFPDGRAEKIGGYVRYLSSTVDGIVRGMMAWVSSAFVSYIAAGTAIKAYAVTDALDDITPIRISGTETNNPFTTTNGSPLVSVSHNAHGVEVGAHVHWSGAATFNNVTMNGEFTVASVTNVNAFVVTALTNANANGAGGGAAVAYEYEINPGLVSSAAGLGYGVGTYGASTYGTARASGSTTQDMRTWFFDGYGDLLIVQPSGGAIYYWDESVSADRAVILTGAPTSVRASFVTNERMVVALGTDTPMTMAWSDRDDITDWIPALDNTANIRTLQEGNKLIAGTRFNEVNVFWSDRAFFLMQFLSSSDEIYATIPIAKDAGLAGATAFEVLPSLLVWFSNRLDAFVYSGGLVQKAPNWDDIRGYIVGRNNRGGRLNLSYIDKMTTGHVPAATEVWFHYVSVDSTDGEPDEYFKVNYETWVWDFGTKFGTVGRTAHVHFDSAGGAIVMAGTDSRLYQHETGVDGVDTSNATIALPAYVETGPASIYKDRDADLNGYVPDWERIVGNVSLRVRTQKWPMSPTTLQDVTFVITPTTEFVSMNMGGRYTRMKISVSDIGADFRLGAPMIDSGAGGKGK